MTKTDLLTALPDDIFQTELDDKSAYKSLEAQTAEARANRIDLIGRLSIEEQGHGKGSWRERVQQRLGLSGDDADKKHVKTIGDYAKVFHVFRLRPPHGLGYSLDAISRHQPGRLRVFAQNGKWALENPSRVAEMLDSGRNEGVMRKEIQEAISAQEEGRTEKPVFENFTVRLSPADAAIVRTMLRGVRLKRTQAFGEEFSDAASTADGQALMAALGEWFHSTPILNGPGGTPVQVPNSNWVEQADAERRAQENTDAPTDTEDQQAAD